MPPTSYPQDSNNKTMIKIEKRGALYLILSGDNPLFYADQTMLADLLRLLPSQLHEKQESPSDTLTVI